MGLTTTDIVALSLFLGCLLVLFSIPFSWLRQWVCRRKWQEESILENLPEELTFGRVVFTRDDTYKPLRAPVSQRPFLVKYKAKKITEEEIRLLDEGFQKFYDSSKSFWDKFPEIGVIYTTTRIKNDWLYHVSGTLFVINDVNYNLAKKENIDYHKNRFKQFWNV